MMPSWVHSQIDGDEMAFWGLRSLAKINASLRRFPIWQNDIVPFAVEARAPDADASQFRVAHLDADG